MRILRRLSLALAGLTIATGTANAALEEIVVEAQRRAQNLQEVPIAVTTLDAAQLEKLQVVRVEDISLSVPNLQAYEITANGAAMQIHARGASVQNPGFITSESPVGIYEDDVYRGRLATANLDLTDVERVEVLRGPQSTLYGRNTIAGAIKIFTRKPGDDLYANASLGYGNYETSRITAAVGGPLVDGTLAGSIAGSYHKRDDGYINNWQQTGPTGLKFGKYDNKAARAKLRWFDEDKFDATLTGWVVDAKNDGYNGIPYLPYFGAGAVPGAPATGFYDNWSPPGSSIGETDQVGATLDFSYDFDALTFRSITGYADLDDLFGFDLAGGGNVNPIEVPPGSGNFVPLPLGTPGLLINSSSNMKSLSQEFHLLGTAFDDSLDWITGFFYLNEDGTQVYSGFQPFVADFLELSAPETDSYAIFAEGSWRFAERWSTTLGLRYTDERKTFKLYCGGNAGGAGSCTPSPTSGRNLDLKNDFDKWTPRAVLNYDIADQMLLYGSISTGFQAGGFQTLCFGNLECAEKSFGPQDVISYELGYKGTLLKDTMLLNLAAFFAQYDDIQQTVPQLDLGGNVIFPVENVGEVDVWGIELEWTWAPLDDLNIFANAGYMKNDYGTLNPNSAAAQSGAKELPSKPDFTGLLGFDYTIDVTPGLDVYFGSDLYYSDTYFTEVTNALPIDSYTRLNAFLGIGHPERTWEVVGEVKNLADSDDNVGGLFVQGPGFGVTNIRTVLPPRTYMVSVRFNY